MRRSRVTAPGGEVTIVANDLGPVGGMQKQLTELVTGLLTRGVQVTVVARWSALPSHPALRFIRVPGPSRPFGIAYPWFFVVASALVARHRRGVVHTTGAIVGNRADLSTVHHLHHAVQRAGIVPRSRNSLLYRLNSTIAEPLKRAGERWCYRPGVTGHVVADSAGLAREMGEHFPAMAGSISVIPLGVDHALGGSAASDRRDAVRADLAVAGGEHLALFVGGDWERKGLNLAVEAVSRTPGWHLLVVGAGDIQEGQRLAAALGAGSRIHFAGTPAGTAPYFAAADAFLLPSAYETFSLVSFEAAAAGLPLLVTRINGVEDILVDGVNGWFIERDPLQISDRLEALGADEERRRGMGDAARRSVGSFTWASAIAAYYALYTGLGAWPAATALRAQEAVR